MMPPSTATAAPAAAIGFQFIKSMFQQSMQMSFFQYSFPPRTQIVFQSMLGMHDVLNDCTMTVGGTDFRIPQKGITTRGNGFGSHK